MNWFSSPTIISQLKARIEELEKSVEYHKDLAQRSVDHVSRLQQSIDDSARNATPSVDFDRMEAFSIERIRDKNEAPRTVIGYNKDVSETGAVIPGEWTLYCNDEHHERLVREFNEYKARCLISNSEG